MSALVDTSVLLRTTPLDGEGLQDDWAVSVVTIGELEAGVLLATTPIVRAARLRRLAGVLAEAPALDVDRAVAARFGELRAASRRVASNDLWIAATALAHDLTLVTGDQRQAQLPLVRSTLVA